MKPEQRRIAVAINPTAAFGTNNDVGPAVVAALETAGYETLSLREPSAELLADAVSAALDEGAAALVVVGGDGMVSLGVNALAGTDIPLGIVPSGTGNDLARGLGIPTGDTNGAIAALLAALDAGPRRIDTAAVTQNGVETRFAGVLSAGFDALVNERANSWRWPKGQRRYTFALLRELMTLKAKRYRLELDGKQLELDAVLISIANNVSIGGGMMIAPDARLDDGLLDLFVVAPVSRLRFLRLFPKVFKGTHTNLDVVTFHRLTSLTIDAPDVVGYADGERIGPLPLRVDVVPDSLSVLA